jgi:hypothetical protein
VLGGAVFAALRRGKQNKNPLQCKGLNEAESSGFARAWFFIDY